MPRYRYTVIDRDGNRVSGEIEAAGPYEVARQLEAQGLRVEYVSTEEPTSGMLQEKLSPQEVASLAEQISGLTQSALPLAGGLKALADELPPGTLRHVLEDVSTRLVQGESLDSALERQGRRLPGHLRGLVEAGVRSGRLGEVLSQYVSYYHVGAELRRMVAMSLVYPLVLLCVCSALFCFILLIIVPGFKRLFMDFGIDLPDVTLSLLMLSDFVLDFGVGFLLVFGTAFACAWLLGRLFMSAAIRRRLVYRAPVFGQLWRWASLAEFSHLLGLLIESELPLATALQLAGEGVRDADIANTCGLLARDIEEGRSLAESAQRLARFPAAISQTLRWGEGIRSVAESLHAAGAMCEGQARLHAQIAIMVAPPVCVVAILGLLSYVVMALFLPLIKLITELSG